MRLRKLAIGVMAIGMPIAVMSTIVGVGAAQALVTGTGTLKCTKIAGTVTFKPPLKGTTQNNNTETQTYKLTATGCKPSGSNITKVTKGVVSQTIHTTDTSCYGLIHGSATGFNFTAVWTSTPAAANSGIAFSGDTPVVVGGKAGFKLPNTGGSSAVTGSFPGGDGGMTSSAEGVTSQTATQLLAPCSTSAGLKTIKITKGSLNLK